MLKYVPGLVGAVAAMAAFRLLPVLDLTLRMLLFLAVYVVVTVVVEKAMERYGRKES